MSLFGVTDVRLCISSFDVSIVFNSYRNCCPSCGDRLDVPVFEEVHFSSTILILVGFGSYLCYKYFFGWAKSSSRRENEQESVQDTTPINNPSIIAGNKLRRVGLNVPIDGPSPSLSKSWLDSPSILISRLSSRLSSTPQTRRESLDSTTSDGQALPVLSSSGQLETPTFLRSFSLASFGNESVFGEQTVGKLDLLLNQIEDIKKSVDEMDAEINQAGKISSNPPADFMRLVNVTDGDILEDTTGTPPSPTMEWDSNDIQELEEEAQIELRRKSVLAAVALKESLHLDLTAASEPLPEDAYSSGKGSMLSSPSSEVGKTRDKALKDMLTEAKRLGIVPDLLDELSRAVKRDSAYYED